MTSRWRVVVGAVLVALLAPGTGACSSSSGAHAHGPTVTSAPRVTRTSGALLRTLDITTGRESSATGLGIALVDRLGIGESNVVVGGVTTANTTPNLGGPCTRGTAIVLGVQRGRVAWSERGASLIGREGPWALTSRVVSGGRVATDVRDAATGRRLWTSAGNEGRATTVAGDVVLFDGTIVVGGLPSRSTGIVTARDAATGRLLWRHADLPSAMLTSSGDDVYVAIGPKPGESSTGGLVAIAGRSGRVLWRLDNQAVTSSLRGTAVVSDGDTLVEVFGGNSDVNRGAVLIAGVAAASGRVQWHRTLSTPGLTVVDDPDVHTVYGLNGGGDLEAFDATTGASRWHRSLAAPILDRLVGADRGVVVIQRRGDLEAFSAIDGRSAWHRTAAHSIAAGLGPGGLYVGESTLACFS
ncbi:MAG TPA: PQQ-binding-like beta-propeller repeat protein [Acidimicrobiia bacterium]|jgi:outer membrane protein assembly factor BamB